MIFSRHKHEWKLIDKTVLPSAFQQAAAVPQKLTDVDCPVEFFMTKVVYVFQCQTCPALKKMSEVNPE